MSKATVAELDQLLSLESSAANYRIESTRLLESLLSKTITRKAKEKKRKGRKNKKKAQDKIFLLSDYLSDIEVNQKNGRTGLDFTVSFNPRQAGPNAIEIANTLSGLGIGDYTLEKVESFLVNEPKNSLSSDQDQSKASTTLSSAGLSAGSSRPKITPEALSGAMRLELE
jgi:hypothetical protein